jgi:hypothetical protein
LKIERIFLDVDDTLNTFTMFTLNRWFMCDGVSGDYDYEAFARVLPGQRDIVKACPLLGGSGLTAEEFWECLPEWCWAETPKSPEFDLILEFAQSMVPRDRIFLATDVTKSPCCLSGKLKWIHDYLPDWMHRQFFITPRKGQLSDRSGGDLLIDDSEGACRKFRARGGRAILVPRPWNCLCWDDTKGYLEDTFLRFKGKQQ